VDADEESESYYECSSQSSSFSNSYLQLFKYDMVRYKEHIVPGHQLVEYNEDNRVFNILFSQCFNTNQDNLNEFDM